MREAISRNITASDVPARGMHTRRVQLLMKLHQKSTAKSRPQRFCELVLAQALVQIGCSRTSLETTPRTPDKLEIGGAAYVSK